jgi:hypothetical protein
LRFLPAHNCVQGSCLIQTVSLRQISHTRCYAIF